MQANRDKTGKMGQMGGAKQQPNIEHGNSVCDKMKPVQKESVNKMNICKGEAYNRGKI